MHNFIALFKISFLNNSGINRFIKSKNKKSSSMKFVLIALIMIFVYYQYTRFVIDLGQPDNSLGGPELLLEFGTQFMFIIVLMAVLSKGASFIFKTQDYDLLASMPIKKHTIFFSKLLSLLTYIYALQLFVIVPVLIGYLNTVSPHPSFYGLFLLTFLLFPLTFVGCILLISYAYNLLTVRLRFKRTLSLIISTTFSVFMILIYFQLTGLISIDHPLFDALLDVALKIFEPANWMVKILTEGNQTTLIRFILINVLPFALFVLLASIFYTQINHRLSLLPKSRKFNEKEIKVQSSSSFMYLLKREIKRYFSIPSYFINTLLGPIMMVLIILAPRLILANSGIPVDLDEFNQIVIPYLIPISIILGNMTPPTSSSISLEGKQFWILKSSPISYKTFYFSKFFLSFILSFVGAIASSIVIMITVPSIEAELMIYVVISYLLAAVFFPLAGLFVNLIFPKFEFKKVNQVVKRSLSTFLSTMIAFAIFIGYMLILDSILIDYTQVEIFRVLMIGLIGLVAAIILLFALTGKKLYLKLRV